MTTPTPRRTPPKPPVRGRFVDQKVTSKAKPKLVPPPEPKNEPPPAVEDWVKSQDTTFLTCRRDQHDFKIHRTKDTPEFGVSIRRIYKCTRCKTKKTKDEDYGGYIIRSKFDEYAEGYLRPRGMGRMDRDQYAAIRREITKREKQMRATQSKGKVN